jgi:hypothetical protein
VHDGSNLASVVLTSVLEHPWAGDRMVVSVRRSVAILHRKYYVNIAFLALDLENEYFGCHMCKSLLI